VRASEAQAKKCTIESCIVKRNLEGKVEGWSELEGKKKDPERFAKTEKKAFALAIADADSVVACVREVE